MHPLCCSRALKHKARAREDAHTREKGWVGLGAGADDAVAARAAAFEDVRNTLPRRHLRCRLCERGAVKPQNRNPAAAWKKQMAKLLPLCW